MPPPKDLIAMATAAGYKQGAHRVRDSQAGLEKPTAESMVSRAEDFYRAFTLETSTVTDESQHTEIYRWIRCVLTAEERYTEVKRCQHLTQTDRNIFGASYVANCSSVDGLGAFLGEQADHSAVNFFQGLEKFRESGAPNVLPAAIERALWQKGEVVDLEEQISLAVTADHKTKLSGSLQNLRRKLKATALSDYREQWVKDRRNWKLLTRGKVSPDTSTSDGNLIVAFIPELKRVERLMLSNQPLSSECMQRATHDLYILASNGFEILYYPGEEPIAGRCQFCNVEIESISVRHRSSHAYQYKRRQFAEENHVLQTGVRFCYIYAEWTCGSLELRRALVRPAHCPWCLAAPDKDPSERFRHWKRDADAVRHIKQDEIRNSYPAFCPLCSEILIDEEAVDHHLQDAHLLKTARKCGKRKRAGNPMSGIDQQPAEKDESDRITHRGLLPDYTLPAAHDQLWSTAGDDSATFSNPTLSLDFEDFMNSCVDLPPSPPLSPNAPICELETITHDILFEAVAPILSPVHLSSGETADLELADEEPPRKVRIIIRPRVLSDDNDSIGDELPSQNKAYTSDSDCSALSCFPLSTPFELFPPKSSAAEHPIENSTKEEMAQGRMNEFLREQRSDDARACVHQKRRRLTLSPFEEHTPKRRKDCNEDTPSNDEAGHADMANNTAQTKSVPSNPEIDSLLKNPDEARFVAIEGHSSVGQDAESCVRHREVAANSDDLNDNVEIETRHLQPPQPLLGDTTSAAQDLYRGMEPALAELPSFPIDAMDAVRGLTLPGCKVWLSFPVTPTLDLTPTAYVSFTIPYDTAFEIVKRDQHLRLQC
ncbi:hypothetical protein CcaCcLH18_07584 [Colletotrichum camelliae]|nr:hypothetical protein CcaCcLH18_07584 [Colletotrichum camelliae]